MKKDTSKYALSSKQARKNSLHSPWRKGPHCDSVKARELQHGWLPPTGGKNDG